MRRLFPAIVVALLLAMPAAAGDDGLTGYWKFSFFEDGNQTSFWLVRLDSKDGKLTASAEPLRGAPKVKVDEIKQSGDTLQMRLIANNGKQNVVVSYEGKLPKPGAKKILGSISFGGDTIPAVMEATSAKTPFEVGKEILTRTPSDPRALSAIFDLIDSAEKNKLTAKDLQELVDGSLKSGELFGPRYELGHKLRLLKVLSHEKEYSSVTLETARKIVKQLDPKSPTAILALASVAEILRANHKDEAVAITFDAARMFVKQLDPQSPAGNQIRTLAGVAELMRAIDKKDEAQAMDTRIENLEGSAHAEYSKDALNFKPEKFAGRKGKSKRIVLVELFTGAMCIPCVAADMGFDGLDKTYSDKEVVLLQYHINAVRTPEPMTNIDADARFEYYLDNYRKQLRGTPSILFNGKPDASNGGIRENAPEKYKEYCEVINKLLESPATIEIAGNAVRTADKIDITAKVTGPEKADGKLRLRLVLVEDWVRFKGANGQQYHHRVVRAFPGGTKGFAIKDKESDHKASVDLKELRRKLTKYLDEEYPPDAPRPMRLHDLHVVAFVQNDDTTEILQAIDVPVKNQK
jgi:hypothetical protein